MKVIPKILLVREIPDWIISSDTAAYQPYTTTIWLKRRNPFGMARNLFHELSHHLGCLLGWPSIHKWLDKEKVTPCLLDCHICPSKKGKMPDLAEY